MCQLMQTSSNYSTQTLHEARPSLGDATCRACTATEMSIREAYATDELEPQMSANQIESVFR